MKFRYRARESSGQMKHGTIEADDRTAALSQLQQGGMIVSDLKPVALGIDLSAEITFSRGSRKVTASELALYCDQLSTLLGAGIPILQSLQVLEGQFKGKKLGQIVTAIISSIEGGNSMSQAMRPHRGHLPGTMIYITAVAEVSGRLDEAYEMLSRQFEAEEKLSRKIRSALTYPVAVLTIALCVVVFMLTFVLPTYSKMFQEMGATLPTSTRILMAAGTGLRSNWFLVPPALVALWLGGKRLFRIQRVRQAADALIMKLPLFGRLRYKRELCRLCRTLATMNRSGVPLMAALLTAGEAMGDGLLKAVITDVQQRVAEGETFGDALRAQPSLDRISVEMIALGEQAGTLDTMLLKVAAVADKDVNHLLERLTALLEPMMTVLIGGLIVGIIVPMIVPMFDILGQIR